MTKIAHLEARRLFREACLLDALLAEAQFWTARVSAGLVAYGWSADPEADRREGLDAALRAIYLDGQNPYAHYSLAIISVYSARLPQAKLAAERAIELSSNFALGHLVLGMARLFDGNAKAAIEPLAHGLRLNPHDPQNAAWFNMLTLSRFFAGDVAASIETARTALKTRPASRPLTLTLACCQAASGNWDEARRMVHLAATLPQDARDPLEAPLHQYQPAWERRIRDLLVQIG